MAPRLTALGFVLVLALIVEELSRRVVTSNVLDLIGVEPDSVFYTERLALTVISILIRMRRLSTCSHTDRCTRMSRGPFTGFCISAPVLPDCTRHQTRVLAFGRGDDDRSWCHSGSISPRWAAAGDHRVIAHRGRGVSVGLCGATGLALPGPSHLGRVRLSSLSGGSVRLAAAALDGAPARRRLRQADGIAFVPLLCIAGLFFLPTWKQRLVFLFGAVVIAALSVALAPPEFWQNSAVGLANGVDLPWAIRWAYWPLLNRQGIVLAAWLPCLLLVSLGRKWWLLPTALLAIYRIGHRHGFGTESRIRDQLLR